MHFTNKTNCAYSNSPLKFISLFSRCGGFDLGFLQAGFQSIGAFDINRTTHLVNHINTNSSVYEVDLSSDKLPENILKQADVFLSGSPCQGFSTIGNRKLNDPRNHLLLVGGKLARKYKPKIFITENVLGVISGKHRKYWNESHDILRESGYKTYDLKAVGTDFGGCAKTYKSLLKEM